MPEETIIDNGLSPLYPQRLARHFGMRQFAVNGINYLDAPEEGELPPRNDDIYLQVKAGEDYRLDLLALRTYGDPSLWWVIAQANRIFNPFDELEAGMTLRVPSRQSVLGDQGA